MKPKSPAYIARVLRETGVTKPKPKSELAKLREENEDLRDENAKLRETKGYLEMDLAIVRRRLKEFEDAVADAGERRLVDWQQKTAQRNGGWR